ncbi:ribosomal protein S5 [candidate division KSB1 bacterium]
MSEITLQKNTAVDTKEASSSASTSGADLSAGQAGKKGFKKNPRRIVRRQDRERSEFVQKIISIRRVTRVMAGGRRFGFSVAMVLGDKKGRVGIGTGKATDTALAIEKAIRQAKKNMVRVKTTKEMSIPHDVMVKYGASVIQILPAKGRGLVAGSSVRVVLELAGIKDVTAKIFSRSKNKLNNAQATIKALQELQ